MRFALQTANAVDRAATDNILDGFMQVCADLEARSLVKGFHFGPSRSALLRYRVPFATCKRSLLVPLIYWFEDLEP